MDIVTVLIYFYNHSFIIIAISNNNSCRITIFLGWKVYSLSLCLKIVAISFPTCCVIIKLIITSNTIYFYQNLLYRYYSDKKILQVHGKMDKKIAGQLLRQLGSQQTLF